MKRKMFIFALLAGLMLSFQSCVEEEGAGVPQPKKMRLEASEYTLNLSTDAQQQFTLRWIDVENATYRVWLSNSENDATMQLDNAVTAGELNVLSMVIPYSQIQQYINQAGMTEDVSYDITLNVTGTPIDLSQPSGLDAEGSTASATLHVNE